MNEAVNAILAFLQIGTVVGVGVWVVATIKSKVDTLVESLGKVTDELNRLTDELDRLTRDHGGAIEGHSKRISRLEVAAGVNPEE